MRPTTRTDVLSIRALVGNTPLVSLATLLQPRQFSLYAKLEMQNLGGSMKDRAAFSMIEEALADKRIRKGSTVIESSSGNMGIGLAVACHMYGLRFICVVDSRTNKTTIRIMETYGAKIIHITSAPQGKSLLEARRQYVAEYLAAHPNSFWPNQYANICNPRAHERTMHEITQALQGKVDYLICAVGTCGTIRGCSDYIARQGLSTKIIAADAVGSVIFGGQPSDRLIPGHGAAVRPEIYTEGMADFVQHMTDDECIEGCDLLLQTEHILAGGSSGAVIMALQKSMTFIPDGANVVVLLPDRGERYLDTIYDSAWRAKHQKQGA